jgi:hypothetical protein
MVVLALMLVVLFSLSGLSVSLSLSLLASTTGRMENCTAWESRLNQKVKSKNDELLAKENDIKDKDASLGQAVEDALGPIRTSSDGKKSKMKSAAAAPASLNADSEGITVEDVEDEDEDEDENEMMDESGDEERRRGEQRADTAGATSSPNLHLILTSSSPNPHLILTSSSPNPHPILRILT